MGVINTFLFGNGKKQEEPRPVAPTSPPYIPPSSGSTYVSAFNIVQPSAPTPTNGSGAFDQGTYDALIQKLDAVNTAGDDFWEFFKSCKGMAGLPMDDRTRTMAALAAHPGLKPEQLFTTAQYYIDVLVKDKQDFLQMRNAKIASEVEGRQNQVADLQKKNNELQSQIEQIKDLMQHNINQINQINAELQQKQSVISAAEATYMKTHQLLSDEINTELLKLRAIYPQK